MTITTGDGTITEAESTATTVTVDYEKKAKELEASMNSLKAEIETLKKANDNASADASSWKKKYRETLDEATRKEEERNEAYAKVQSELEGYKSERRVAVYTTKLIDAGYDSETAKSMAPVLPENLDDSFFANQKSFLESQKLKFKTESLNAQPGLSSGMPMSGKTAEQMENDKLRQYFGLPTK